MNSKSPINKKQANQLHSKRKLGKSHENPGSPNDNLRSSHTEQHIDHTLDKLRLSIRQPYKFQRHQQYLTSDGKRNRIFGAELSQNSLQEVVPKYGNFMKTSGKKQTASTLTGKQETPAYCVTFNCPSDSATLARFAAHSSSSQQLQVVDDSDKDGSTTILQQNVDDLTADNIVRVTQTTPLDEVDFMLSHSQIATQIDEAGETARQSRSQLVFVVDQMESLKCEGNAKEAETSEQPCSSDISARIVPHSPSKFNCFAPVKPNKGQLPLMRSDDCTDYREQQRMGDISDLPHKIMDGSGHQSSSLCQMHSPTNPNIHKFSQPVSSANSHKHGKVVSSKQSVQHAVAASHGTEKQSRLWERSSLQTCHHDNDCRQAQQDTTESRALRDIDLGSANNKHRNDSLLDNSAGLEHFRCMKGLEHLAQLSIDDHELHQYQSNSRAVVAAEKVKTSPRMRSILQTVPRKERDHFADSRIEDESGNYLEEGNEPIHFSTADPGCGKNPVSEELELKSIPTDLELLTRGNYDDLGLRSRHTPDDSKILSSIMHHESSHYQSVSALSLIQNHIKQSQSPSKVEPFATVIAAARHETQDSNHKGYLDKPISFGKDFATRESQALSSAQKGSTFFRKNSSAQSPALPSQPSPQFEQQTASAASNASKAVPQAPKAPLFNPNLMKKIRQKITGVPAITQSSIASKKPTTKFVSIPVQPVVGKVSDSSIFHRIESKSTSPLKKQKQNSLDEMLWCSIKKHFQKTQRNPVTSTANQQSTLLDQSSVVDSEAQAPRRLENILNYQRSIIVQTSILRNKLGPDLYAKIDHGDIHELSVDALEGFLACYPKENEVDALRAAIQRFGVFDFREALNKLECSSAERFMLQVLNHSSDLQKKAEILLQIIEMSPQINSLLTCIQNWIEVGEKLAASETFIEIVTLTHKFMSLVSAEKFSAATGFDLRTLTKLFELKSTLTKEKSAYHIILKQYLLRKDPKAGRRFLQDKDHVGFWKRLPTRVFEDDLVAQAKQLHPLSKLMTQLGQIQESSESLEAKLQFFQGPGEVDRDFSHTLKDYLEFYDTKAKPELIHFTQNFKDKIFQLTEFLGLQSSDLLEETIASLLKFSIKHKEFVTKLLEHKRRKTRTQTIQTNKIQSSRSPQAIAQATARRYVASTSSAKTKITTNSPAQGASLQSRLSPRTLTTTTTQPASQASSKQPSDSKVGSGVTSGGKTGSARRIGGGVLAQKYATQAVTRFAQKSSPRASARVTQISSNHKLVTHLAEPKLTPTPSAKCKPIDKAFAGGAKKREAVMRTETSPVTLSKQEKESLERQKIAQEEKRFTTYLKRHYSPNAQVPTGVKTARFEYLQKLQFEEKAQRNGAHGDSTSQEVRARVVGVSVFSTHSAKSQTSNNKENYASVGQKPYYSGEYSVPMTSSQVQKLKVKSSSVHSNSSTGGSRPWHKTERSPALLETEMEQQRRQTTAQRHIAAPFVRASVAGTETSVERRSTEGARAALEYFQMQAKTASMPKFFSPSQQKASPKIAALGNEKQPAAVSQSMAVAAPQFRKGLGKASPGLRRPPASSRPSSRQSNSTKHEQSMKVSPSPATRSFKQDCSTKSSPKQSVGCIRKGSGGPSSHSVTGSQNSYKLLKRSEIQYAAKP